ncbi:hypothetical protein GCM10017771_42910 [Streptomyces capitiformicae]|uniref:Uncharacterized protein n=1 Tax=Streptomyces capitiformicae TaxID=2014920 RepID=A0A918YWS7_9ACTN|nr:hypothetical protein GCM10017771_42910 [Streptomyces capitiformicae]
MVQGIQLPDLSHRWIAAFAGAAVPRSAATAAAAVVAVASIFLRPMLMPGMPFASVRSGPVRSGPAPKRADPRGRSAPPFGQGRKPVVRGPAATTATARITRIFLTTGLLTKRMSLYDPGGTAPPTGLTTGRAVRSQLLIEGEDGMKTRLLSGVNRVPDRSEGLRVAGIGADRPPE